MVTKYLAAITHKQFSTKGGYAYLCASIIASAVGDWQRGKFDILEWLESECSSRWFDYLGMDKEWFGQKLKETQPEGSGIIRKEYE